jgi:NAD(P)-dependent dehydrogenase (short-subunit alcohol dehydrogenase family)
MQVPNFSLSGKTALVTGGNGGIGLGFARGLVANGANVVIWGTNAEKNAAATAELSALSKETKGGAVAARVCDVGDQAQVSAGFADAAAQFGRVDAVFVNAGIAGRGIPFHEMPADEWHRVMRVNLDGAFFTAQEACRHMMDKGGGSIVFTTSGSAALRRVEGRTLVDLEGHRRGVRAVRHPQQLRSARLDRKRHDPPATRVRRVQGQSVAACADAALGRCERFQWCRRLSCERPVGVPLG